MLHIVGPGLYGALVPVGLPGVVQLISMAHSVQRVIQTKCISKPIRSYRTVRWLGVSRSSSSSAPQRRSEVSLCRTDTLHTTLISSTSSLIRSMTPPNRRSTMPISSPSSPISSIALLNRRWHFADQQHLFADQ